MDWIGDKLIQIEYAGYLYEVEFEGGYYTATCCRSGRVKTRLDTRVWVNDDTPRQRVTDDGLVNKLETTVRAVQSLQDKARRYGPSGSVRNGYHAPGVVVKGRKSRREGETHNV